MAIVCISSELLPNNEDLAIFEDIQMKRGDPEIHEVLQPIIRALELLQRDDTSVFRSYARVEKIAH